MANAVIFLAAGSGSRIKETIDDKLLYLFKGKTVFSYSLEAFKNTHLIDTWVVVYRDEKQKQALESEVDFSGLNVLWVLGGKERQDSVFLGLKALAESTEVVYIHDCARLLIRPETLKALHEEVLKNDAVVLGKPAVNTIKEVMGNKIERHLKRALLWEVETPQVFRFQKIKKAYEKIQDEDKCFTDDAEVAGFSGIPVSVLLNPFPNPKLTRSTDIPIIVSLMKE